MNEQDDYIGSRVIIKSGEFKGLIGIIESINQETNMFNILLSTKENIQCSESMLEIINMQNIYQLARYQRDQLLNLSHIGSFSKFNPNIDEEESIKEKRSKQLFVISDSIDNRDILFYKYVQKVAESRLLKTASKISYSVELLNGEEIIFEVQPIFISNFLSDKEYRSISEKDFIKKESIEMEEM